jgi:hypothetical protein
MVVHTFLTFSKELTAEHCDTLCSTFMTKRSCSNTSTFYAEVIPIQEFAVCVGYAKNYRYTQHPALFDLLLSTMPLHRCTFLYELYVHMKCKR